MALAAFSCPLPLSRVLAQPRAGWNGARVCSDRSVAVCATRSRGRKPRRGGDGEGEHRYADSAGNDPPEAEGPEEAFQPRKNGGPDQDKAAVNGVANSSSMFNKLKDLGERYEASKVSKRRAANVVVKSSEESDGSEEEEAKDESAQASIPEEAPPPPKVKVDKDDPSFNLELGELQESVIKEPRFKMTLTELLDEAKVVPLSVEGDLDVIISGIHHDSRQVNSGDMFVCCIGETSDGHSFVPQAAEQGAVVIVATKEVEIGESVKAVVIVSDTNSILSALAGAFYGRPSESLAVVGITGTNGKTTTSYLLRSIYESMGLKTGLIGTISYSIHGKHKQDAPHTTPDAVYLQKLMATMVHNRTEVCVMEVSSHALAQDRCKEIDFDVAVFTNLTRDHMDYHENEDSYKEAKGKLFASMVDPARHRKVVNIDDPNAGYFVSLGNPKVPVVTFGMEKSADVHPLDIQLTLFETNVLVKTPRGNIEISSGLLGRHNVYNILAAVSVGIAVDAPLEDIVRGIEEVDSVPGRVELVDEEQPFAVIVDYAHTPDALSRLLDTVRECGPRRIITVVGCGGDRDRGKRPVMAKIAAAKSEVCIFTSDNPRSEDPLEILDDMLAGVGWSMDEYLKCGERSYYPPIWNGNRVFVYDLRKIAVRAAVAMGEEGDAVVIAGKGHEKYQIIGKERKYHDDREECREALLHVDMLHASGIDTSEIPWKFPGHKL
ncbi:UDP-N-acetylmuramoyl-L-alanyl-D-glutamate--2,6-diaminopimelate ligase MurE homolog, chloroplastic [Selaginella moellendorffii]|nr:UDP-N-acetylmuramoyl-L-alanyl-D-glutamate--2,6-diaminopimelate ligase MurE homolog, chloroplastic [Selaginella moellendorffii]|eukprot:XP_024517730.1 UDP-N-acetylmuramoyl-L-alanyl-D-glutamate--2,6-diaminopimelate ligase MurE homolog, chloroplastic [Selaginella moellendorffii]